MKTLKIHLLLIFALLGITACKEDEKKVDGTTPLKVRMMDAPGNFSQVNIDIRSVECTANNVNITLNVNSGVYNLLDFVNGMDTLIASADVPSGTLSQIRLILGPNNTVKVDGVVYPLATPSAMQSGLKLNLHSELIAGVEYILLLDFDANQSIVLKGNGEYQLKPVIRTVSIASSGSIHGNVVTTLALPAVVVATDGVNTYTTTTDISGNFLLRGVAPGTYSVKITPMPPLNPVTVPNIIVTVGNQTELGAIVF